MKNILIITWLIVGSYFAVTADYSSLTKNSWDTLTATNWNQLVDNVKWIVTDSSWNVQLAQGLWWVVGIWSKDFPSWNVRFNLWDWDVSLWSDIWMSGQWRIDAAHNMIFYAWEAERMRISNTWNVWIWTSDPQFILDMKSGSWPIRIPQFGHIGNITTLGIPKASELWILMYYLSDENFAWIGSTSWWQIQYTWRSHIFRPYSDTTTATDDKSFFMRWWWEFGIGIRNPDARLHVNAWSMWAWVVDAAILEAYWNSWTDRWTGLVFKTGTSWTGSMDAARIQSTRYDSWIWTDLWFQVADDSGVLNTAMTISEGGAVWIWTKIPNRELEIKSLNWAQIRLSWWSWVTNWNGIEMLTDTYNSYMWLEESSWRLFIDNWSNGQDITISSSWMVWIWNLNPQSKLAVSGLPSGSTDSVADWNLVWAVCITNTWNMYIDTDWSCAN